MTLLDENIISTLLYAASALQALVGTTDVPAPTPTVSTFEFQSAQESMITTEPLDHSSSDTNAVLHSVPFYSQFKDISSPVWQRRGCGIASLTMILDFYNINTVRADDLLYQGIANGSYIDNVGWIHRDLALLANQYGIRGQSYDYFHESAETAFSKFSEALKHGPVIASVHYTFDYTNPIPHLVVMTGMSGDVLYYNDPANEIGGGSVSKKQFLESWKRRYIAFSR